MLSFRTCYGISRIFWEKGKIYDKTANEVSFFNRFDLFSDGL